MRCPLPGQAAIFRMTCNCHAAMISEQKKIMDKSVLVNCTNHGVLHCAMQTPPSQKWKKCHLVFPRSLLSARGTGSPWLILFIHYSSCFAVGESSGKGKSVCIVAFTKKLPWGKHPMAAAQFFLDIMKP